MRRVLLAIAVLLTLAATPSQAPAGWGWTTRYQPLLPLDSINWSHDRSALVQSNPGAVFLALPRLVHSESLLAVRVVWQGGPGHVSDPVSVGITVPTLEVWHVDGYGNEAKLCWAKDDGAMSPAEYEEPHAIVATGCGVVDLSSGDVFVRFSSEFTSWLVQAPDYRPGGVLWSISTITG